MEESVTLDGFQINTTGDYCIQRSTADNCTIQDMIFKYGGAWHCYDDDTVGGTVNVINCVFFSTNLGNGTGIHGEGAGATINLYNTTIYGFNLGVYEDNATINVTNCAVCNNNDDFDSFSTGTISFCASDDEDGANSQLLDNTNNYQDEFTDAPNGDFTLPVGSICIENGTDNPSGGLYSDDIISVARSSTWDIGVFEYVGGGGPAAPKLPIGLLVGVY